MSAPKARRIDFYPDEYIAGVTGTLTTEEQGVYWLVCSLIYSHGGPIDNDPKWLSRMFAQTLSSRIKRVLDALLEKGKLSLENGKLSQSRAKAELKSAQSRIEANRKSGQLGGRPRGSHSNEINGVAKPNGSGDQNPTITTNYQPSPPTIKESEDPAFGGLPTPDDDDLPKYAFEARTIRLTPVDFHRWQMSFPHLPLRAELEGLDEWAGQQAKWFPAVAGALAKREREFVDRLAAAKDARTTEAVLSPEQRREAQRKKDLEGIF
jgi:uncharacterized protein YdaU (DUF1376 family)